MFSMIKWLSVVFLCLVVIGFWRGWFSFSKAKPDAVSDALIANTPIDRFVDSMGKPASSNPRDKMNVVVSVDRSKIRADVKKVKEKIKEEVRTLEGKPKTDEAK